MFQFQITNPARGRKLLNGFPNLFGNILWFQITNPARGRKRIPYRYERFLFHPVSNHKPRKGTETSLRRTFFGQKMILFQITNPARGRKLKGDVKRVENVEVAVSNHKPRKGTETFSARASSSARSIRFKSQTPQGDGNHSRLNSLNSLRRHKFQITNPARGRKRDKQGRESYYHLRQFQITNPARGRKQVAAEMECRVLTLVSNHKPRKGTETRCGMFSSTHAFSSFQITNPARGRKQLCFYAHYCHAPFWFQITNPARGRKHNLTKISTHSPYRFQITNPARG